MKKTAALAPIKKSVKNMKNCIRKNSRNAPIWGVSRGTAARL